MTKEKTRREETNEDIGTGMFFGIAVTLFIVFAVPWVWKGTGTLFSNPQKSEMEQMRDDIEVLKEMHGMTICVVTATTKDEAKKGIKDCQSTITKHVAND